MSVVAAASAWLVPDTLVLRLLAGVAAASAVTGAVVMRRWDRLAGKQVAELTRARASDEWKHEERVAELETDLDESRELRAKLEARLRAKRGELAALRGEHAALLRRYATAETERASALEGRRRLAIEASAPAKALPPADADGAPRGTVSLYLKANAALDKLARVPQQRTSGDGPAPGTASEEATAEGKPEAAVAHERPAAALHPATRPAAAVVPHTPVRRPLIGGFDFFGTKTGGGAAQIEAVQNEDLADVVGAEALALHKAEAEGEFKSKAAAERAVGEVIDLTAHDETEQIDVAGLRSAMS
ncbi:hypothetical protein SAMN05421806_107223 [Streptomyces indicus]|uniref:Secreted protein n=1 Tax=Streptomyces indicus TaxID=417292 RepID=A0A1G9BSN6_9ACTN|nr:hypothetical protein SAMN05421806_107223 [Streptomyces indicus]